MILSVKNLHKNFGDKVVLEDINFAISKGEIVGLIGPNGSGKTTLLNVIIGMIKPSNGAVNIARNTVTGMSISRKGFFNDMTVCRNLLLYARFLKVGEARVKELMQDFFIDYGDKPFGQLSAGMKQRIALAFAFLLNNDLTLLDEPINHLDIDSILHLRSRLLHEKQQGGSFLITSHVLSDLEKVCDRLLFLKNGRLVEDTKVDALINKYGSLEESYLKITSL
jgi:ABC-2 type transport system ATP-binding protein